MICVSLCDCGENCLLWSYRAKRGFVYVVSVRSCESRRYTVHAIATV